MAKFSDPSFPPKQKHVLLKLYHKDGSNTAFQTLWNEQLKQQYDNEVQSNRLEKYEIVEETEF